jgi:hypothetical protein
MFNAKKLTAANFRSEILVVFKERDLQQFFESLVANRTMWVSFSDSAPSGYIHDGGIATASFMKRRSFYEIYELEVKGYPSPD